MGRERDEKVRRFREKKELQGKISHFRTVGMAAADEETQREFYMSLIILAIQERWS